MIEHIIDKAGLSNGSAETRLSPSIVHEAFQSDGIMTSDKSSCAKVFVLPDFPGLDGMPWYKYLWHENGSYQIWRWLDEICDDEFTFTLLLMGKINIFDLGYSRVLLESRNI